MSIPFASGLATPGCIYRPGESVQKSLRFHPAGYFFVMLFGDMNGTANLWGIPSDLLEYLKDQGIDDAPYWTNTAVGNELSNADKTAGYMTMSRMIYEVRFSQVEEVYAYWDYSPTTIVERNKV